MLRVFFGASFDAKDVISQFKIFQKEIEEYRHITEKQSLLEHKKLINELTHNLANDANSIKEREALY